MSEIPGVQIRKRKETGGWGGGGRCRIRDKISKINKPGGGGGGLLFRTGEYRQNKHNFASVGFASFKIKQKHLII